jgi:hypothetical protein
MILFTFVNKAWISLNQTFLTLKKSQHGCVRWALREHLTPPCSDFPCGGLEDCHQTNIDYHKKKHVFLIYL